jgi:hypothetical protein
VLVYRRPSAFTLATRYMLSLFCAERFVFQFVVCMGLPQVFGRERCGDYGLGMVCIPSRVVLGCGCWTVCGGARARCKGLVQGLW